MAKENDNFFLVIEGLDGAGKTEISLRLNHLLSMLYRENARLTFEPHDPSCGGLFIRQVLMKKITKVSDKTLALAFAANRLDHCDREINPFLDTNQNRILICDRYYLSSLTYQATDEVSFEEVLGYNDNARLPDLTIFLDASNQICFERMKRREEEKELFERNLNQTRKKYQEAISFLRQERKEKIIEVNADAEIDIVLQTIVNILLKEGPDWLVIQPVLSTNLLPNVFTLNGKRNLTIADEVNKYQDIWNRGDISSEKKLVESLSELRENIFASVSKMPYNSLGSLFLDYLVKLGYEVGEKIPWTDLDGYQLEFSLPNNLVQRGAALLLGEAQRYDVIQKKASMIENLSDFMFIFQPSILNGQDYYYVRDLMKYSEGSISISPTTKLIGKEELVMAIYEEALKSFYEEHFNTLRARSDLLKVFEEYLPMELL